MGNKGADESWGLGNRCLFSSLFDPSRSAESRKPALRRPPGT